LASKFELEHYFRVATPKIVVTDGKLLENVRYALNKLKVLPLVIVIDDGDLSFAGAHPIVSLLLTM
jgi:hypothetical protein